MHGPDYLAYATLEQCEAIYAACISAITDGQGTVVIGISGGGESEQRQVITGMEMHVWMRAAMRRMSTIDPNKYPPRANRLRPSFTGIWG